jgi:hypothetical protein
MLQIKWDYKKKNYAKTVLLQGRKIISFCKFNYFTSDLFNDAINITCYTAPKEEDLMENKLKIVKKEAVVA